MLKVSIVFKTTVVKLVRGYFMLPQSFYLEQLSVTHNWVVFITAPPSAVYGKVWITAQTLVYKYMVT